MNRFFFEFHNGWTDGENDFVPFGIACGTGKSYKKDDYEGGYWRCTFILAFMNFMIEFGFRYKKDGA